MSHLHEHLAPDDGSIEEAKPEPSKFGTTGFSNPQGGDGKHNANCDTWEDQSA